MNAKQMKQEIADLKERVKRLELGIKPTYGTHSAYDLNEHGGLKGLIE